VTVERRNEGEVAVLTLAHPPVNALGAAVRTALRDQLLAALTDASVRAIVLNGAGDHFSAGADIREFGHPAPEGVPSLPDLITLIEDSRKPVVAALHGTVAGGGFELALGCHYRVAGAKARLALPEVSLGFVPGAGGTQHLPRLAGLETALDVIVGGAALSGPAALQKGVVDEGVDGDPLPAALALATRLGREGKDPRRAGRLAPPPPKEGQEPLAARLASLGKGPEGRVQRAAIECIRASLTLPLAEGLAKERAAFLELVASRESKALRHVFFAERDAQKVAGLPAGAAALPVRSAGVVGFGTMGVGIAMAFANAGLPVAVREDDPEAVARGLDTLRRNYAATVAKGRLTAEEAEARRRLVRVGADYEALADADVVVEAVYEELEAKFAVFGRLQALCRPEAILATNTSSLDVNRIASAISRPGQVVGMHFFSPAHVMKLVEIVRADQTAPATLATVQELTRRLGKIGVVVGVCDGFVGNRMLYAYRRQADFLAEEGAVPEQVDRALRDFGFAMGPFQTSDLAGLDISWRIRKRQAALRPPGLRYSPVADRLCERGRFGQKAGAGWYRYERGDRTGIPDPEVTELIRSVSRELGIARRDIGDEEIVERCLSAMINEGFRILEEGLVARPGDVDVIWIHGYGFPRYRGGPMFHAETIGLAKLAGAVERMHEVQGDLVKPSGLLRHLAATGETLADLPAGAPLSRLA